LWERVQNKTVEDILEEISKKTSLEMEGKVPRDRNNNILDFNKILSDIKTFEISFSVDAIDWNQLNNTEFYSDSPPSDSPSLATEHAPSTTNNREKDFASMELAIRKEMANQGIVLMDLTFPNKAFSKVEWNASKTLRDLLSNQIANRQFQIEDLVPKDAFGNTLDWNCPAGDLRDLNKMSITLVTKKEDARPFTIYLPKGQIRESPWDPYKELRKELQMLFEAKPDLQNKGFQPCNINEQPYLDLSIKLHTIQDRSIYFGTTMREWTEYKSKIHSLHSTKSKRRRQSGTLKPNGVSGKNTSKPKLPKVTVEDPVKKPATALFIYLPDGSKKAYNFEKQKESELGELLDKIVKDRGGNLNPAIMGEPLDSEGNPLDRKKKLKDLGTYEVSYGMTLQDWMLRTHADTIQNYLKREGTTSEAFKVYLPQGQVSSSLNWNPKKLSEVLQLVRQRRAELSDAVAKDLQGNDLDPNKTLEELDLKEICFGVSILDWIEYKEKEKNVEMKEEAEDNNSLTPRQYQRFGFLLDLDKQQMSPTRRPPKPNGQKSPHRKTNNNKPSSGAPKMKGIDYSKIVENLNKQHHTVDEIQFAAQLTSFWHMQHSELDDEKLFEHYMEEEGKYKFTFMVPYPFLKNSPQRKKPWEMLYRELNENVTEDDAKIKFIKLTDDTHVEEESLGNDIFTDWMRSMEKKVNEKREEFQSVSVVLC